MWKKYKVTLRSSNSNKFIKIGLEYSYREK